MQIEVKNLFQFENDGILVAFSSPYGCARGLWKGDLPKLNQCCNVELDVPQTLLWGTDIIVSECTEYKIWSTKDHICLHVKVESLETDGCLIARLGDSMILMETEGIPYSDAQFLEIQLNSLLIYPSAL